MSPTAGFSKAGKRGARYLLDKGHHHKEQRSQSVRQGAHTEERAPPFLRRMQSFPPPHTWDGRGGWGPTLRLRKFSLEKNLSSNI